MTWGIRSCALAAAAAALLSTQAVYAAPVRTAPAVDPLVSLSIMGTAQSRAAVCGTGISGAPAGAVTCGLPAPMITAAAATAAQDQPPPPGKRFPTLAALIAFLILLGIAVAILSGGGDSSGDLTPVSPQ